MALYVVVTGSAGLGHTVAFDILVIGSTWLGHAVALNVLVFALVAVGPILVNSYSATRNIVMSPFP